MENMETITDENKTYILKVKDETSDVENSESKQLVLINSPVTHEDNASKQMYVSSLFKNKKVLLKEIRNSSFKSVNVKRLTNTAKCSERYVKKRNQNHPMNQEPVVLNPTLKVPRRKLSYETVFKPSIPSNRGSYNGFIRFGRRRLIVDQQIMISTRQFKEQLMISDDLIAPTDLAPRTKREMQRLLTGITKLFAHPAHKIRNSQLLQLYISNCTSNEKPNAESFNDMELMPLGYEPPVKSLLKIISRKRKNHLMKLHRPNILEKKRYTQDEILVEAANSAHDHEYTKQVEETIDLAQEKMEEITEQVLEDSQEMTDLVQHKNEVTELVPETTQEMPELVQQEIIEEIQKESETDPLQTEIKSEEDEVFTIKSDELYTIKSEDESDDRQVVIIQRLGENIALSQQNLETLLAAARSDPENRIVTICKSSDLADGNGFVLVQDDENGQVFQTEPEIIISN